MPELPEVETIKRVIEPQISGRKIKNVTINNDQVIGHPTADEFCKAIIGQTICRMGRCGKFMQFFFDSGDHIILHLRMTGCLLIAPQDDPLEKHTHLIFHLDDNRELRFSDPRRFGRLWLASNDEADIYSGIDKLGIEPFDEGLTADYLKAAFGKRKKAIKGCLLEQSTVCGIGNIYSDEILFSAKIYPARAASTLSDIEWMCLAKLIPERLSYFIDKNVITFEEYLCSKGQEYRNTPFLQVYGHAGEPCPICGKTLCRSVLGGRGSVFCPKCQT